MRHLLGFGLLALFLSGCGEKPPAATPEGIEAPPQRGGGGALMRAGAELSVGLGLARNGTTRFDDVGPTSCSAQQA